MCLEGHEGQVKLGCNRLWGLGEERAAAPMVRGLPACCCAVMMRVGALLVLGLAVVSATVFVPTAYRVGQGPPPFPHVPMNKHHFNVTMSDGVVLTSTLYTLKDVQIRMVTTASPFLSSRHAQLPSRPSLVPPNPLPCALCLLPTSPSFPCLFLPSLCHDLHDFFRSLSVTHFSILEDTFACRHAVHASVSYYRDPILSINLLWV